jgi:hypothetical protein
VVREKVVKLAAELQQKGKSVAEAVPTNAQFSVVLELNRDLCSSSRWNSLQPRAGGQNRCTMLPVFEVKKETSIETTLIMPEPCPLLSEKLPVCSIIRPTKIYGPAMGAVKAVTADGLFIGQSSAFLQMLHDLAADADAARRE